MIVTHELPHDWELERRGTADLRAGVRVSSASIVWTVASSAAAVVLGAGAGSLVLVAFGLTGLLDAVGSAMLVVHFRHALRHESFSERHERAALRVVTLGLVVIGVLTLEESTRRLISAEQGDASTAGMLVAAASVVVLAFLAHRKHVVAQRLSSRALQADAGLSMIGCLLAAITVAGTGLNGAFGWWWADPVAAAFVGCGALLVAVVVSRT